MPCRKCRFASVAGWRRRAVSAVLRDSRPVAPGGHGMCFVRQDGLPWGTASERRTAVRYWSEWPTCTGSIEAPGPRRPKSPVISKSPRRQLLAWLRSTPIRSSRPPATPPRLIAHAVRATGPFGAPAAHHRAREGSNDEGAATGSSLPHGFRRRVGGQRPRSQGSPAWCAYRETERLCWRIRRGRL
jgi:hypothetical protein